MSLLNPASIAVIGASNTVGKIGHAVIENLKTQGYSGTIYPVNPKNETIQDLPAFRSVLEIPEVPDMVVFAVPAMFVNEALKQCGEKGVKEIVIISAGFGEVHTAEGDELERELIDIAAQYDLRVVGPNCLGVLRPPSGMNASFFNTLPPSGDVALISQSGAIVVALMDSCLGTHPVQPLGFSLVASIGNKTVLDACDYLELCRDDPETKVIGLYLESINDGQKFLQLCQEINPLKPIVLLKSGVSAQGAKAASSHTGALAGNDAAIEALVKQSGITRAHTLTELIDLLAVKRCQPTLAGRNIAVITNAGGAGILASDAAEQAGLHLPELSEHIQLQLKEILPAAASYHNPIDVLGDTTPERYQATIEACLNDPKIDGICAMLTPQAMIDAADVAKVIGEAAAKEPLVPIVASFMGEANVRGANDMFNQYNVPHFSSPLRAITALSSLQTHTIEQQPIMITSPDDLQGSGLLDPEATKQLLERYHLPHPNQVVATNAEEAVAKAGEIGYPVIAKINSPDLPHKTDIGGVIANIISAEAMRAAFDTIVSNVASNAPSADVDGVMIQPMLPAGNEFIVGGLKDPSFGPMVMVGLGGIYAELFKDTSFRIAPITKESAYTMLSELISWKLLLGMRGKPQQDIDALADVVVQVATMMAEHEQIESIDLNPVLVRDSEVMVVDAKITLK